MKKDTDLEAAIEYVKNQLFFLLVAAQEYEEECRIQGKKFDKEESPKMIDDLLTLLDKHKYEEGVTGYVKLIRKYDSILPQNEIDLLKSYATYLGLNPEILDGLMSMEEVHAQGQSK
jgi:hypothetical protein